MIATLVAALALPVVVMTQVHRRLSPSQLNEQGWTFERCPEELTMKA
jgi:hypothetical protein